MRKISILSTVLLLALIAADVSALNLGKWFRRRTTSAPEANSTVAAVAANWSTYDQSALSHHSQLRCVGHRVFAAHMSEQGKHFGSLFHCAHQNWRQNESELAIEMANRTAAFIRTAQADENGSSPCNATTVWDLLVPPHIKQRYLFALGNGIVNVYTLPTLSWSSLPAAFQQIMNDMLDKPAQASPYNQDLLARFNATIAAVQQLFVGITFGTCLDKAKIKQELCQIVDQLVDKYLQFASQNPFFNETTGTFARFVDSQLPAHSSNHQTRWYRNQNNRRFGGNGRHRAQVLIWASKYNSSYSSSNNNNNNSVDNEFSKPSCMGRMEIFGRHMHDHCQKFGYMVSNYTFRVAQMQQKREANVNAHIVATANRTAQFVRAVMRTSRSDAPCVYLWDAMHRHMKLELMAHFLRTSNASDELVVESLPSLSWTAMPLAFQKFVNAIWQEPLPADSLLDPYRESIAQARALFDGIDFSTCLDRSLVKTNLCQLVAQRFEAYAKIADINWLYLNMYSTWWSNGPDVDYNSTTTEETIMATTITITTTAPSTTTVTTTASTTTTVPTPAP